MTSPFSRLGQGTDLGLEHSINTLVSLLALLIGDRPQLQLHQVIGKAARVLWTERLGFYICFR